MIYFALFVLRYVARPTATNDSDWGKIPAFVSQVTKLGPLLFCVMINDLSVVGISLYGWPK